MPRTVDEIVRDYFTVARINVEIIKFGPMLRAGAYPVLVNNQNPLLTKHFEKRCPNLVILGYNNELIMDKLGMHLRFAD